MQEIKIMSIAKDIFTTEEVDFMAERGIRIKGSSELTDEILLQIEDEIGDILCLEGFDSDYSPYPLAILCESIIDKTVEL